jgi:peptidoglycan hydrolase CwlO-like protein
MTIEELVNKIFVFVEEQRPPTINDMNQWIKDIEDVSSDMQNTIGDLRSELEDHEAEIARLREQNEELEDELTEERNR